jgi:hypothetical protein
LVSDNVLSAANQIQINGASLNSGAIYGVLLAAGAYTPGANDKFLVQLYIQQDSTFLLPSVAQSSFFVTRPNDTTAYAAGDWITSSTSAGAVSLLSSDLGRSKIVVTRVRLHKSTNGVTNPNFAVAFFSVDPGAANDNAAIALAYADSPGYLGAVSGITAAVPTGLAYAVGEVVLSQATPTVVPLGAHKSLGATGLYAGLFATAAYAPGAQENFRVDVEYQLESV